MPSRECMRLTRGIQLVIETGVLFNCRAEEIVVKAVSILPDRSAMSAWQLCMFELCEGMPSTGCSQASHCSAMTTCLKLLVLSTSARDWRQTAACTGMSPAELRMLKSKSHAARTLECRLSTLC